VSKDLNWNTKAFEKSLEKIVELTDSAAQQLIYWGGMELIRAAQENFEGFHAKGQPRVPNSNNFPNVVTGQLRRSISMDSVTRLGVANYAAVVAPRMVYGRRVELGYKGSNGYPYFTPAYNKVIPALNVMAKLAWSQILG